MKKTAIALLLLFAILGCDKKTKVEKDIENTPVDPIRVARFDKAFFEAKPADLPALKKQYPEFFPAGTPDSVWINKMRHPLWRELYREVEKKFGDFGSEQADITELFKHIKYYYPATKTPVVITLINEMDYNNKVIYHEGLVVISLELYLGKKHKFYEFPEYLTQNFEPRQLMPDIAAAFAKTKIPPPQVKSLLGQMIYAGKELYLKDLLLPDHTDAEKIGYTPEQIQFCQDNEGFMWQFFVEEKLLYSTDGKLSGRFINPAPFSKFYLEIDNETPGRIGTWVGWQIVRAYKENNDVTLQQLLQADANEIFSKSKYKPKKNE